MVIFFTVYLHARPHSVKSSTWGRAFALSCLLAAVVFAQFFFFTQPPVVDYWRSGWGGTIRYLNEQFKAGGKPYHIPEPGNN